jgi:osmotically-inducible protein OsmY
MTVSRVMRRVAAAAIAVALLCGAAACAEAPRTDAQKQADNQTAQRVQAALDADRQLYSKHITVRARDGVVHLSGYVWDPSDLTEATETAELVEGVKRVVNNLELQQNGIDNSPVAR